VKAKVLKVSAAIIAAVSAVLFIGILFIWIYSANNLDTEGDERLFEKSRDFSSTVFYKNADPYGEEYIPTEAQLSGSLKKVFYPLGEISPYIKEGFIAVEDNDFYTHSGIDIKRTVGAAANYLFGKGKVYGASTITQQVVKNISGDNEPTLKRKFTEILRAKRIEKRYDKADILEVYLNVIPMGGNMYGIGIASRTYFGKEPSELLPEEAATLIGVTNAPSLYSPYSNPDACLKKRNIVLRVMYEHNIISESEYERANATALSVVSKENIDGKYDSWFTETVISEASSDLAKKYNLSVGAARLMLLGGGYSVYTTMDSEIQDTLEEFFENESNLPSEIQNGLEYAMTVVDSRNGNLLGIIGRIGEKNGNRLLNHATIPHTPASVLKPLALYAPMIDSRDINWATVFDDVPQSFKETKDGLVEYPRNSPAVYDGLITVKDALKYSKNTIAVKLCNMRGARGVFNTLKNAYGFDTLVEGEVSDNGRELTDVALSPMALGQLTRGVSLLKLTESYAAFAADGRLHKTRSYIAILNSDGECVIENKPAEKVIMKPETARIMNQLLSGVVQEGTAKSITLKNIVDTAGKTGTSSGNRDKLFIGYTPYYTSGIWCGYDSGTASVSGVSPSHLQIWDSVMSKIHERRLTGEEERLGFSTEGLIRLPYCKDSGKIYTDNCIYDVRGDRLEYGYFTFDNRPSGECDRHVKVLYDAEEKAVANSFCPRENLVFVSLLKITERSFPREVFISDAEYVYRDVGAYDAWPEDSSLPYFYYTIPDGEYVGVSGKRKQFNSGCYLH